MPTDSVGAEVYVSTDDLIGGSLQFGVSDDDVTGRHLAQAGFLPPTSVYQPEYVVADEAPNLVALAFSVY